MVKVCDACNDFFKENDSLCLEKGDEKEKQTMGNRIQYWLQEMSNRNSFRKVPRHRTDGASKGVS